MSKDDQATKLKSRFPLFGGLCGHFDRLLNGRSVCVGVWVCYSVPYAAYYQ